MNKQYTLADVDIQKVREALEYEACCGYTLTNASIDILDKAKRLEPVAWMRNDGNIIHAEEKSSEFAYTHHFNIPLYMMTETTQIQQNNNTHDTLMALADTYVMTYHPTGGYKEARAALSAAIAALIDERDMHHRVAMRAIDDVVQLKAERGGDKASR